MELDIEQIRLVSAKAALPMQFVIKEFHVMEVLAQIVAANEDTDNLIFKGGTAINKAYFGGLARFSEDLDFDLADADMQEARKWAEDMAGKITGYKIGRIRRVRKTFQVECAFQSPLGTPDKVRIDIAAKPKFTAMPVSRGSVISTWASRTISGARIYSLDDLLARKLCALSVRCEGKDVYDVFHALPLSKEIRPAIMQMLKSEESAKTPAQFLEAAVSKLHACNPKKLRDLTNPFIPSHLRPPNWAEFVNEVARRLGGI